MKAESKKHLPPSVMEYQQNRFLRMRNRSGRLEANRRLDHLRQDIIQRGPLATGRPQEFVQRLLTLEDEIGTRHAVLAGLLAIPRSAGMDIIAEGIEIFDRIDRDHIPTPDADATPTRNVEDFFALMNSRIAYDPQFEFLPALRNLEAAFKLGRPMGIGNCIVSAGVLSVLAMAKGFPAGEARAVYSYHGYAYLQADIGRTYHVTANARPEINFFTSHGETRGKMIISSSFSFVASLLVYSAEHTLLNASAAALPSAARGPLLGQLECAELINPFNSRLFEQRSKIHFQSGEIELYRKNVRQFLAVKEVECDGHGNPTRL
ncbi:MAG: hypothetical protein KKB81_07960 [Candidatus Margulisbacteria bacterium]|nr:hypothetical protein [Candidatus Margulisiibacteriota bacterium]MBU1021771.1 hypothetical protein [Candidatus Margulisiibacteriota bacterium]